MILKIRLNKKNIENINIIKNHYFDVNDKITSGYIVGLAVDNLPDNVNWKELILNRDKKGIGESKSTSLSLRQDTYEKLINLKVLFIQVSEKSLSLTQIISIILELVANKINEKKEKIKKLKIIEWNINSRAGYTSNIPVNLIIDQILEINPDVVILTEFVKTLGFLDLKTILEEKYYVYTTDYKPNQNGILIAIAKKDGISVTTESIKNLNNENMPDFLEKDILVNQNRKIKIIGTRIQTNTKDTPTQQELNEDFHNRNKQFENCINYTETVNYDTIIGSDFNHGAIKSETDKNYVYKGISREFYSYQQIWRKTENNFKLVTPHRGNYHKFSYIDKNNIPIKEDHFIISKSLNIESSDYNWNFITKKNGYGDIQPRDYKSFLPLPDHAIAILEISF